MEIDELAIKITGDSTSLQSALKNATDEMNKLGINTSTLSTLLGAAGLTAIFKMAFDAANQMVEAFRGDEVAALKYNAALQASNKITNEGKAALDAYVPVFASLSGIAEADTQSMIAMLAAYGRTDEQIKTMMQTAQGMANVLGIDVNTALTQLNMTFSGTTGRLAQQTPALKDLTAEQLKNGEGVKLLAEKYEQFSDVLKDSTDVSIKNYQNAYSDMMSAMGSSIAATLKPLRDAMTDAFRWIADDKTGERAKNTLQIIELGLVAIVAAINPVAGAISGAIILITNLIGQVSAAQKAAADAAANAAAKWAEANKGQADDLDAMRLKALTVAQDRAAEEKKTADATAKAWEDAEKKIIEGRKTASKQYTDTLAQIDTRVKLGIMTEQEAADAKYAANKKLIDDLIALGYTGAANSKSIGDQTLREAIARNDSLYANTRENVDKRLLAEYDIYLQQKDVAAWEEAYLAKKKASEEALAEGQRRLINKRLETTEEVTAKEDAAEERLQNDITAGLSSTAQHAEQMAARKTATEARYWKAADNAAAARRAAEEKAEEEAADDALAIKQRYINRRLKVTEQTTIKEDEIEEKLQAKITAGLSSTAQHAEQMAERRKKTAETAAKAITTITEREAKAAEDAYIKAAEETAINLLEVQKNYNRARLTNTEYVTLAEEKAQEELDRKITEGASSAAQHAEQMGEQRKKTAERVAQAIATITEREAKAREDAYNKEIEEAAQTALKVQKQYISRRLEATEQVTIKEDMLEADLQKNITAGLSSTAQHAEQMAERRRKTEERHLSAAQLYALEVIAADEEAHKSSLQRKIEAIQAQLQKDLSLVGENEEAKKILITNANKAITAAKAAEAAKQADIWISSFTSIANAFGSIMDSQTKTILQGISNIGTGIVGVIATGGADITKWASLIGSGISFVISLFDDSEERAKAAAEAAKAAAEAAQKAQSALQKALDSEFTSYSLQYAQKSAAQAKAAYLDYYATVAAKQAELASYPAKMAYEISQVDTDAQGAAAAIRRIQERYAALTADTQAAINTAQNLGDKYKAVYDIVYSGNITAAAAGVRKEWYDALQAAVDTYGITSSEVAAINEYYSALVDKTVSPFKYALQDANKTLADNESLFKNASKAAEAYNSVLSKVVSGAANFYASLQNVGSDIASKLLDNFKSGLTKANFLDTMKEYLTDLVLQSAIYTDALKTKMAEIGTKIAAGIASGMGAAEITSIRDELSALYESASASATAARALVESAFTAPTRALGGVARGATWVGERGAELVDLPVGSYVHDAQESKRIAADRVANSPVFNFYSPVALTPAEMKRQFKRASRQMAFMGAI